MKLSQAKRFTAYNFSSGDRSGGPHLSDGKELLTGIGVSAVTGVGQGAAGWPAVEGLIGSPGPHTTTPARSAARTPIAAAGDEL